MVVMRNGLVGGCVSSGLQITWLGITSSSSDVTFKSGGTPCLGTGGLRIVEFREPVAADVWLELVLLVT